MSFLPALPAPSPRQRVTPSVRPSVRVRASPPPSGRITVTAVRSSAAPPVAALPAPKPPADSTYLCVHSRAQRANKAVAYYSTADNTLYCGELPSVASLQQLKHRLSPPPAIILTASAVDSVAYCDLQTNELQPMRAFTVKSLPLAAFSHDAGKARLQLLRLTDCSDVQQHIDRFRHRMYLRSLVDLDNPTLCGCIGALLSHLVTLQLPGQSTDSLTIATIRSLPTAAALVHCDALTAATLGLFASDAHPGSASTVKEGVSVFAALNKTKSGIGGRMLREWLTWPTNDRTVLEARLDAIEFFMQAENEAALAAITASLRQCLHHLLNIDEAVSHLTDSLPLMKSFRQPVRTQLANLLNSIPAILDLDTSTASSCSSHPTHPVHLSIQYDIDPHLDQLKHQRTQLPHLLARLVANDSDDGGELEGLAGEFVYVYMQQVGFLVRMEVGQGWTGGDWLFEDGGYDFYKSERTRQLDAEIGDIDSMIADMEDAFVRELQSRVQSQTPEIRALAQRTYELDCYMALASAARDMRLIRPQLRDDSVLQITRGRHMLQERYVDPFIPNDTHIGEVGKSGGQIHIITGPNRSGKSVYIEQVGLIAYLALCGCFVPAESAVVALLDGIYACISTVDSVTSDMSSFCQESAHMAYMQRHATGRSLCLIDEYGKGTATNDGAALLTAALQCWAEKTTGCPLVLASTHYHEMFTLGLIQQGDRIQAHTMTFIDETDNKDREAAAIAPLSPKSSHSSTTRPPHTRIPSIIPLFKLQPGICTDSYALSCSQAAALPIALLDRSAHLMAAFQSSQRITPWQYVMDVRAAERAERNDRLWSCFKRLVKRGLEMCADEEVEGLRTVLKLEEEEMKVKLEAERERREAQALQTVHRSASRMSITLDGEDDDNQEMND